MPLSAPAPSLNLFQKLSKVRNAVEVLQKNKEGFNYTYVTEDEILSKVTAMMKQYHLSFYPEVNPGTLTYEQYHYVETKTTKQGQPYEKHNNEILVKADMTYTWVNDDDPAEHLRVPWGMVGQQADASQAFGSGLSYSSRYFLLKFFNVATVNDDPDAFRAKQKQAAQEEDRKVLEALIAEINRTVKAYLDTHETDAAAVKAFLCKYVKDGNYFKIKDTELAGKILREFNDTFQQEGEPA